MQAASPLRSFRSAHALSIASRWPLVAILAVAALLRTWQLSQNGYGRQYYAASVLSMMHDPHNFFFNSFDPGGFVSLDKPPVAIWVQVLGAKLIGFGPLATLLPQVVLGLTAVALVYFLVQRSFGRNAGVIAGLLLALTPASVAIDRSNNTDSCLIFVLLLAVWAGMRAAETTRLRLLLLSMALIGIGFNVKMGVAVAIAPALVGAYFLADRRRSLRRWAAQAAAAGMVLIATSLAWVAAYDLTPAGKRPYVGSTDRNSMFELTLLHNGVDRFIPPQRATERSAVDPNDQAATSSDDAARPQLWDTSPTSILRLLRPHQAGQIAWLLPFALLGLFLGWRGMREDARQALRPQRIAVGIWGGWLVTYWVVFSFAGGPFHTYYLSALAPPLAALAGISACALWRRWRVGGNNRWLLPVVLFVTAAWQTYLVAGQLQAGAPRWLISLWIVSAAVIVLGGAVLATFAVPGARERRYVAPAAAGAVGLALLAMPTACALSVVLLRPNVAAPAASLAEFSRPADTSRGRWRRIAMGRAKLLAFLERERGGEKFLVAVPNALVAAPLILRTRMPVMAFGGYAGRDPILTPHDLSQRVAQGEIRFVMLGGFTLSRAAERRQQALADWVRANGKPVDATLWRLNPARGGDTYQVRLGGQLVTMAMPQLFDLRK